MTDFKDGIRECYRKVLGRVPDEGELESQLKWMRQQDISVEMLPYVLKQSPEYARIQKSASKTQRSHLGYTFSLNPADRTLISSYAQLGQYESTTTSLLSRILAPGMNVLNIGANIGYFAIIMSGMVGPGKIFAFEPLPDNVTILKKNIRQNNISNIQVIPKAASDVSGQATLHVAPSAVHNYLSETHDSGLDKITVESVSIDDFEQMYDIRPDLVLMDAEGSEKRILDGMTSTILKNPDMQIITEYNPHMLEITGTSNREFLDACTGFGFSIYDIDESGRAIRPAVIEDLLDYASPEFTNIYLTRKSPAELRQSGIL